MKEPKVIFVHLNHFGELVRAAMPNANEVWLEPLYRITKEYGIFDERLCMFLAQVGHESNDCKSLSESLNYSADALTKLFGRHRISVDQAIKYGRTSEHPADQEMLANILYGGEWGRKNLGNIAFGDGALFKGRGLIQLTGRANYTKCGSAIGVPLSNRPELLSSDRDVSVMAACWFFETYTTGTDITKVTRQVNGGTNGLEDRRRRYTKVLTEYNRLIDKHLIKG